jgi:hypothetical protein
VASAIGNDVSGASGVSSTLNNLCSSSVATACSETSVRTTLAQFNAACASDIASNADVKRLYDTIYAVVPFRTALCTKDESGRYCATQVPKTSDGKVAGGVTPDVAQKALTSTSNGVTVPNANAFASYNVPFLMISPDLEAKDLCTTCTKNILLGYMDYESTTSYAPGINNSALLVGQSAIYSAVKSKCDEGFLGSGYSAAGAAGQGILGGFGKSGAERTGAAVVATLGAVAMAVFAVGL